MAKTWSEKMSTKKQPVVKTLNFDFAGLKEGTTSLDLDFCAHHHRSRP
jgi:hypothetical protein